MFDWNVRGVNSEGRQRDVRAKVDESNCSIVYIQETKMEFIDHRILRKFLPRRFDNFVYSPSVGASGGILVAWCSSSFNGSLIETQKFGIIVNFTFVHNAVSWNLVAVYGPCRGEERETFVSWLYNLPILPDTLWLVLGDFNFIRAPDSRNKPGGDVNDMFIFNEVIGHLGLEELPLKGRAYTWSNMQAEPLLEQLDWFFTTPSWTTLFPNTVVTPMAKPSSDHVPCMVNISTDIPKSNIFRFDNFWVDMPGFMECVSTSWKKHTYKVDAAARLAQKL